MVRVRDESWTVARTESFERCTVLTLEGCGPDNRGRRFHAVTPFDHVSASQSTRPRRRKRRTVLRGALAAIARERPALGLWTAAAATLDLFAYQLEPALAVLRGATRVLLADGVGLGKTIQAGLILAELRVRGLVDRALILCPAGLRESWATELGDRFGIVAAVLDHTSLAINLQDLPAGVNPWAAHPVVIASIDLVKRPEVIAAVEEVPFDLVIADEAHHLTPDSDRGHAVSRLASRAPWVVLVSATPHSGDQAAFSYLTAIGSLGDPLVIFRRGRSDIGLPNDRRARLMCVTATHDEARLLRATDDYARDIWQARGQSDHAVQLVAITLARRAASSAAAVALTLARRRALLAGAPPPLPLQASLPWEDGDHDDGDELDERLARPGLSDEARERRCLDQLIDLAHCAAGHSSKLSRLRRFLKRAGEPAVVFTEYRDTLQAAADFLASTFRLGAIHGGVPAPMRQEVLRQFDRGDLEVLIATDTAGEGLNLHRRCRLVIDLELPWNPLRLEQRIGRVDRIGQRRRVHAVHLVHRGTVEDRVWNHLERRRHYAEQALGEQAEQALAEQDANTLDTARAVFDDVERPPRAVTPIATTRMHGAADELARVTSHRQLGRHAGAVPAHPIFAIPRHARQGDCAAVALFERTQWGPGGRLIERRVVARTVALHGMHMTAAWREVVIAIGNTETTGNPKALSPPLRRAVLARIAAARTRLASEPVMHQSSLFDRRAERTAGARREVAAQLDAALARRAASLSGIDPQPVHSRLVALWPLPLKP